MTSSTSFRIFIVIVAVFVPFTLIAGNGPGSPGSPKHLLDHLRADVPCIPHTLIVKFAAGTAPRLAKTSVNLPALEKNFAEFGVSAVQQMYPGRAKSFAPNGSDIGIERMYRISYSANRPPLEVARAFDMHDEVEYAEPELIHEVSFVPNDPMLAQQYAIDIIHAKDAWDITRGDRSVIIGIVDTGVLWTHEDLKDNMWINPGEDINHDGKYTIADINGIDDDGDGYVDDIIGIDLVGDKETNGGNYFDNDPLPTATGNPHGTHVSGIAAAVGDNGKGIAGVANGCRIMALKCGADNGGRSILRGYDAIVYAADHGARIINCSWGGGGFVQNEVDRIDYAISKGALVVAAAGNDGAEVMSTPGAYPNVLSVANTDNNDRVNFSSTYGSWVDVSAPGTNILSTVSNSTVSYESAGWTGTSMASPCAAGVAALVASRFPELTPLQIAEKVRVTSDPIDSLQQARYRHKIGFGRVNAYRALTVNSPAIKLVSWSFRDDRTGNGNGIIDRGETIEVFMKWKNYLDGTTDATFTLSSTNPNVAVTQAVWHAGAVPTGAETSNDAAPFIVKIRDVEAPNDKLDFNYDVVDGAYKDFGGVITFQQPTYRDHDVNNITVTLSNDGNVGFDDFQGARGKGFLYKLDPHNVLFEGALMVGAKPAGGNPVVVDVARDESGNRQCTDFLGLEQFIMKTPGATASQEGFAHFDDRLALTPLGIDVSLHSYAFNTAGRQDFVILRYLIRNISVDALDDLHAGVFFDWDIGNNSQSDRAFWDTDNKTFYAYDTKSEVKIVTGGTVLTRDGGINYFGINNPDVDAPPLFGIYDGFTKDEKWRSISSGIEQPLTKITDISTVIANGPYQLAPGDSVTIAFAIFGSSNASDLLKNVPKALEAWTEIQASTSAVAEPPVQPRATSIESVYPNPVPAGRESMVYVSFNLASTAAPRFELRDMLGRIVAQFSADAQPAGRQQIARRIGALRSGTYFLHMMAGGASATRKLVVMK